MEMELNEGAEVGHLNRDDAAGYRRRHTSSTARRRRVISGRATKGVSLPRLKVMSQ